ncbi:MAG TPA: transcription termination/antitermination protein NusG [Candidatus Azoamicus sp.]
MNKENKLKKWYIIQTVSGHETKVKEQLQEKILHQNLNIFFGKILIPTEDIIEIKAGKKYTSKRKIFPGYILIEMQITDDTLQIIKNIKYIFGFVGGTSGNPASLSEEETKKILDKMKESSKKPKPKKLFETGEMVRVIDGPFSDFNGTVEEINYDKNRLCVGVLIFGRSTPIDLDFSQVEKI